MLRVGALSLPGRLRAIHDSVGALLGALDGGGVRLLGSEDVVDQLDDQEPHEEERADEEEGLREARREGHVRSLARGHQLNHFSCRPVDTRLAMPFAPR